MHLLALASAILAAHNVPEQLPSDRQLAQASATLRTARRYENAAILMDPPFEGVRRHRSRAVNPPRKLRPIEKLPRKLANARRRLARQTAAE